METCLAVELALLSLEPAGAWSLPINWGLHILAYRIRIFGGDRWRSVHRAFQIRLGGELVARFCWWQRVHRAVQLRLVRKAAVIGACLSVVPAYPLVTGGTAFTEPFS